MDEKYCEDCGWKMQKAKDGSEAFLVCPNCLNTVMKEECD